MKKYTTGCLKIFICVCLYINLIACNNSIDSNQPLNWSIYVYMCGSTLEAGGGTATRNIAEMLSASMPEDAKIIIETGGCRTWRDYDISKHELSRYEIKNGELKLIETIPDRSMGDADVLYEFLSFCTSYAPAEHSGLIFWDHGTGSTGGVCYDPKYSYDYLSLPEIDDALSKADKHFDFIGFDTCLMSNYETASIISKHADHMIASENVEPSGGWDYASMVSSIGQDDFYDIMLDSYAAKCEKAEKSYYTLSHIDFTNFNEVESAFTDFCEKQLQYNAIEDLQAIFQSAEDTMYFGGNGYTEGGSDLIDLAMFAERNGYGALSNAISNSVTCINGSVYEGAGGLSFYFPIADTEDLEYYMTEICDDEYNKFLTRYYLGETDESINFVDRGSDKDGEIYFELTADSNSYVKSVKCKVYQSILGDECDYTSNGMYCLGLSDNIIADGNGGFTTSFEGHWYTLGGIFITCEVVDENENITIYTTNVKCNGVVGNIRFAFDSESGEYEVLGFIPLEEDGSQGRMNGIKYGDEIIILREKLDENYNHSLEENDIIIVDDSFGVSMASLPDGYYQFYVIVTDLYDNEFLTKTILAEYKDGKLIALVNTYIDYSNIDM